MATKHPVSLPHDNRPWEHSHDFSMHERRAGESRTFWVMLLTFAMMVVEIAAGWMYNSMALLADGWHMSTHAAALGIGFVAYRYARLNARNAVFTFGTGKVHALGSYTSAVMLAFVALFVAVDSIWTMFVPKSIAFNQSLLVAFAGLAVNLLSVWLLHVPHGNEGAHDHHHGHAHDHAHGHAHHDDQNLKAAYAHVIVDAMTSVLAILALLGVKYLGWTVLDPLVGLVGAVIIAQWSWALIRNSMQMLLDRTPSTTLRNDIKTAIEADGDSRVADLHLWTVAPGKSAAIVSIVSHRKTTVAAYKQRLKDLDVDHVTVEVNTCGNCQSKEHASAQ